MVGHAEHLYLDHSADGQLTSAKCAAHKTVGKNNVTLRKSGR